MRSRQQPAPRSRVEDHGGTAERQRPEPVVGELRGERRLEEVPSIEDQVTGFEAALVRVDGGAREGQRDFLAGDRRADRCPVGRADHGLAPAAADAVAVGERQVELVGDPVDSGVRLGAELVVDQVRLGASEDLELVALEPKDLPGHVTDGHGPPRDQVERADGRPFLALADLDIARDLHA